VFPTDWVKDRIATLARHHPIVWVEDPYRLLDDADLVQLRAESAKRGQCRRRTGRTASAADSDDGDETDGKDEGDTE